jgi:hypothetical protein
VSLVEQAWQALVPPAAVDAERWLVLPLADGRALVKDMHSGRAHTERSERLAHVFVTAAREAEAQRRARDAASTATVRTYGAARALVRALS